MPQAAPAPSSSSITVDMDRLAVDTIRTLSMDGVQAANSGHPGTPMALAPLAYRLFTRHLRHDPAAPDWADRDRFVLSCGHASMLLYSTLFLSGYGVSLDDLRNFRQLHSPTAGHPERGEVPGVEFTTGPLGQGISSAVGMALAERMLHARFEGDAPGLVDHRTFVIASDGDLMEGVQSEAASLAGHLGLGHLVLFWDDNKITIDGTTDVAFTEDVGARYAAYGWQVLHLDDVNDLEAIDGVVAEALADTERPTLVVTRTHIGFGSPRVDTSKAHGEALGEENVRLTKEAYGWPSLEPFFVPDGVLEHVRSQVAERAEAHAAWNRLRGGVESSLLETFDAAMRGELPDGWDSGLAGLEWNDAVATRAASGKVLNAIAAKAWPLVGGSADLAASNNTDIAGGGSVQAGEFAGRVLHFGVREHAMGAVVNGMLAHGGLRTFAATFLIFSDYMRPSIRLAALQGLPSIYLFTHDSIGLGEDGPTHQPVEQLSSLRAMPNLVTFRPADGAETAEAWRLALERTDGPTAFALTRQGTEQLTADHGGTPRVAQGGYVLRDPEGGDPQVVLVGTGSEVGLAIEAAETLAAEGVRARVVSMPSVDLFLRQPRSYRDEVLPPALRARVAVEAASPWGWTAVVGDLGEVVGLARFGLSAPAKQAYEALGITAGAVVEAARTTIAQAASGERSDDAEAPATSAATAAAGAHADRPGH